MRIFHVKFIKLSQTLSSLGRNGNLFGSQKRESLLSTLLTFSLLSLRVIEAAVSVFFSFQSHAYIVSFLKEEMPLFRRDNKKRDLIYDLPVIFSRIQQRHQIPAGDFPDCAKMQVCYCWNRSHQVYFLHHSVLYNKWNKCRFVEHISHFEDYKIELYF